MHCKLLCSIPPHSIKYSDHLEKELNFYVCFIFQIPKCNGAEIIDYRLQWGQVEESMHLIYTGPCLRYEVKGLIPATTYFCRVQVDLTFPSL